LHRTARALMDEPE